MRIFSRLPRRCPCPPPRQTLCRLRRPRVFATFAFLRSTRTGPKFIFNILRLFFAVTVSAPPMTAMTIWFRPCPATSWTRSRTSLRGIATTTAAGDPYERTKERLLLLYAPSRWVMASRILHHPHLGDTRPSVLMSKMLALLPRGEPPGILFQTAWLERLPAEVRSQVSIDDLYVH